jgi:hypothetical protein
MTDCIQSDRPGLDGEPYCRVATDYEELEFLTCLCGTEGTLKCFRWRVSFAVECCEIKKCEAQFLGEVNSSYIKSKACGKKPGDVHSGWPV